MPYSFLPSRLQPPAIGPQLMPRPRLQQLLGRLGHRRVLLVSAPAGYGKTALLVQWLTGQLEAEPFAWLTLDGRDDDPRRFLAGLAVSLQQIDPTVGETAVALLAAPQPPPVERILASLLHDLTHTPQPLRLLLDDLHHLSQPMIFDCLQEIVENSPPHLRLVLSTRSDPPLPLARWRARDQLSEIRQADLQFELDEARHYLNQKLGLDLTPSQVAALEARTEGWAAGLQLAALALGGRSDTDRFIVDFQQSHRFIIDYLGEEVLAQQPAQTRRFLIRTAVVERLNAELCNRLADVTDGQQRLLELERTNLFIQPLDEGRRWFRYHHLFRDMLQVHLEALPEVEQQQLHLRAANWLAEAGLSEEALLHYLAAQRPLAAAALVEAEAFELLHRGALGQLTRWLAQLPAELVATRPWLGISRAWTLLLTGQGAGLPALLQGIARRLDEGGLQLEEASSAQGHIAAIQAYFYLMGGQVDAAAGQAERALMLLPAADLANRSVVRFVQGGAALLQRDSAGATAAFAAAAASGKSAGNLHLALPALSALGNLQLQAGGLQLARETFTEVVALGSGRSGQPLPLAAPGLNGWGQLAYEWNILPEAEATFAQARELASQWGNVETQLNAQIFLARTLRALGREDEADRLLAATRQQAQNTQMTPGTGTLLAAASLEAWLTAGKLPSAARYVVEHRLDERPRSGSLTAQLEVQLARLGLARGELSQAEARLLRLLDAAKADGRVGDGIALRLWLARLAQMQHRPEAARWLTEALQMGEPEGYIRTFVDAGVDLRPLLEEAALQGITPAYTARLLNALQAVPQLASPLAEPLTAHELNVLRQIANGRSNTETAAALSLSVNTIKYHLKNIYAKLDVHSRVEALSRARELGLIA